MRLDRAFPLHATDAPKSLAQDCRFEFELAFVGNVLVVAAAADAKVPAGGLRALRRGFEHPLDPPAHEFLLLLKRSHRHHFIGQDERHKHGVAVGMAQALAPVHEFFNFDVHDGL